MFLSLVSQTQTGGYRNRCPWPGVPTGSQLVHWMPGKLSALYRDSVILSIRLDGAKANANNCDIFHMIDEFVEVIGAHLPRDLGLA